MKKNLFLIVLLLSIVFPVGLFAQIDEPGTSCENAPYVATGKTYYLTKGDADSAFYWFRSSSYDFPLYIEFVWDQTPKQKWGITPRFMVDFSCTPGVYEDTTLYKVVEWARDELDLEVPTYGKLYPFTKPETPEKLDFNRTFSEKYRTSLYMFGVTQGTDIMIQVCVFQDGYLSFNSESPHAICHDVGDPLEFGMEINLDKKDSVTLYKWPMAEWAHTNYQFEWIGEDELYVAQGQHCNVDRMNEETLDYEHFYNEDYNGVNRWNSDRSLKEAKDYSFTDEFFRFYPEGKGVFKVTKLPAFVRATTFLKGEVVAEIDSANRTITAVLPKNLTSQAALEKDYNFTIIPDETPFTISEDGKTITLDDGFNTQYTLNITTLPADASTDATLNEITVDGKPIADFSPTTYEYTVNCDAVPVIGATTTDSKATYDIVQPQDWDRKATITVTAEDIYVSQEYIVNVILPPHSDATLRALRLDDNMVPGFNSETTEYEIPVKSAAYIPYLCTFAVNDIEAEAEVTNYPDHSINATLPQYFEITCTAGNGDTKVYTITFIQAVLNDDATLKDLQINGVTVDGFNPTTTFYSATVGENYLITAVPNDEFATAVVGERNNWGMVPITVTAEDGSPKVYNIMLTIDDLADATLQSISLDGVPMDNFAPGVINYDTNMVVLPQKVEAIANDPNAIVSEPSIETVGNLTTILIKVTAPNGVNSTTYSIIIHKINTDATLAYMSVDGGETLIEIEKGKLDYEIKLNQLPEDVDVIAEPNDPEADMQLNKIDNRHYEFVVTAQDGKTVNTYTLTINLASSNTKIDWISVDGNVITDFEEGVNNYIPVDTFDPSTVTWHLADDKATDEPIWEGNTLAIYVYAENQINVGIYVFIFQPNKSNDATLASLTVGEQVFTEFTDEETNTINLTELDKTKVSWTTTDENATAAESWNDNTLTLVVTAEDGVATKTYTFEFILPVISHDATLEWIKADGQTITDFRSGDEANLYKVSENFDPSQVTWKTTDDNATVVSSWNTNELTLVVTAQDGETTLKYIFDFDTPEKSHDATLAYFSLNGQKYTELVIGEPGNTFLIPSPLEGYDYETSDPTARVEDDFTDFPDKLTLVVTAEDGVTTNTYIFYFIEMSHNADLKSITIGGKLITNFVAGGTTNNVQVSGFSEEDVVVVLKDDKASYDLSVDENNLLTLVVTAEDGQTKKTYLFQITILSDDATLAWVKVGDDEHANLSAEQTNTIVVAQFDQSAVTWKATDDNATVQSSWVGNQLTLTITAQNAENQLTYVIVFAELSHDADLATLVVNGEARTDFQEGNNTVAVSEINHDNISWTTSDPNATVKDTWTGNRLTLVVTAVDGITSKTYTFDFVILSNNANLASIKVDGKTITKFTPGETQEIIVSTMGVVSNIEINAADANATVEMDLSEENLLTVTVTAQDGVTTNTYYFQFIELSHDADLLSISFGEITVTEFVEGGEVNEVKVPKISKQNVTWVVSENATVYSGWRGSLLTLTVTAEDKATQKTYVFQLVEMSHNSFLQSVTIDGTTLTNFSQSTTNKYKVQDLNNVEVEAEPVNEFATVDLQWDDNILYIVVTAEDGTSTRTYTFELTEYSHEAELLSLIVGKLTQTDFVGGGEINEMSVSQEVTQLSQVKWTISEGAKAEAKVENLLFTINITAEDGVTTDTYVVMFNVLSGDNYLKSVSLDGENLATFKPNVFKYSIALEQDNVPEVDAVANSELATLEITQPTSENPVATIVVTAESGETRTYTFTFTLVEHPKASLVPYEVVFKNGFKAFIDGLNKSVYVYYLATESIPNKVISWKAQEGTTIDTLELISRQRMRVVSKDGEAIYNISYVAVENGALHTNTTYDMTGSESYIKTAYSFTESRGWRISKDYEEASNRRVSRGKDRIYLFLPGCAAIKLNTTTASRSIRVALNGVDITEQQRAYDSEIGAMYSASQGGTTYIGGLTLNQPMMLEIESSNSTGDFGFDAITLLREEDPLDGLYNLYELNVAYYNGVIYNPDGLDLQVYSITGQLVTSGNSNIDITAMPSTVYLVKHNEYVMKIVKF